MFFKNYIIFIIKFNVDKQTRRGITPTAGLLYNNNRACKQLFQIHIHAVGGLNSGGH